MLYEDDKILTIDEYQKLAQEYLKALDENNFKLISAEDDMPLVKELFENYSQVSRCLFCLGGFLNTSRLYSLTCKQIKTLQEIYNLKMPKALTVSNDKTKIFLHYLGCESSLILSLIKLSKTSKNIDILERMIIDRLVLTKNIFQKK